MSEELDPSSATRAEPVESGIEGIQSGKPDPEIAALVRINPSTIQSSRLGAVLNDNVDKRNVALTLIAVAAYNDHLRQLQDTQAALTVMTEKFHAADKRVAVLESENLSLSSSEWRRLFLSNVGGVLGGGGIALVLTQSFLELTFNIGVLLLIVGLVMSLVGALGGGRKTQ